MQASQNKEIDDLKIEISQRDKSHKQSSDRLTCLELQLEALQEKITKQLEESERETADFRQRETDSKKHLEDSMMDLMIKHDERIDTIKKENSKKSSLARTLLTEREEENNFLKAKNEELVSEIKSGAPSERRIFELAEVQAKREAVHGLHG